MKLLLQNEIKNYNWLSNVLITMSECLEYIFCCLFLKNNESGRTVHG